jgi:hypothetical protein
MTVILRRAAGIEADPFFIHALGRKHSRTHLLRDAGDALMDTFKFR